MQLFLALSRFVHIFLNSVNVKILPRNSTPVFFSSENTQSTVAYSVSMLVIFSRQATEVETSYTLKLDYNYRLGIIQKRAK